MILKINKKINVIVGKKKISEKVHKIFDQKIINFLDYISQEIFKNKKNFEFKDLVTFAFWIRKKNILKISLQYNLKNKMLGNGIVFHLSPSNIPMNFAYSLVFGLLSGNNNILRLPSKKFIQTEILCNILNRSLKKKKFIFLQNKICLIRYEKSDEISQYFSKIADARLIWGGDNTITQFKKFYTSPGCVDITFPDRYSLAILGSEKIINSSNSELNRVVEKFYNDSYIMDQKGCSSPQEIVWFGKKKNEAKIKFYKFFSKIIDKKFEYDLAITNEKISNLSVIAARSKIRFKSQFEKFNLVKIKLKEFNTEIEKIRPYNGSFVKIDLKKMGDIKKIISKKCQTISFFGLDKEMINRSILETGALGVHRIVPIGRSLDMSFVWDGKDLIYSLSRIVAD